MTIRPKYESDNTFPPATLYLDDVEKIVEVLKEFAPDKYRKTEFGASVNPDWMVLRFFVGDTVCDTIPELREIGGRTKDFHINGVWFRLDLDAYSAKMTAVGREGIDSELHGRLLPIFKARRHRPNLAWARGGWMYGMIPAIGYLGWAVFVPDLRGAFLRSRSPNEIGMINGLWRMLPLPIFLFVAWLAVRLEVFHNLVPHSTVVLRYRRDPVPETSRWMPRKQEIVKIVIGGILGWILGFLSAMFTKKP